jgi:hypothetical protein
MGFPNVKTKPSTGSVIDRSGSTAVTTAAAGTQSVMSANESRTYLVFQNISDTVMNINFGATALTTNSIHRAAGRQRHVQLGLGAFATSFLRCSSTGKEFVAKEGI